jgi:hypothetical protein
LNHNKNRTKQFVGKDFHCRLEFPFQIPREWLMEEFNP